MISVLVTLLIVGVALYCVELVPMDGTIKRIIQVLVILMVVLWVLEAFGLLGGVHFPALR